ncbi:MAG: hypothetical protein JO086_01165 [Acidimicrobiia bacterium]|nr:hypothetical protein [Acidimicrobiia bacterium]
MEDRRVTDNLGPGTRVEVRSGYGHSWASGFEVADVDGERYLVRRVSDGHVLPEPFDPREIRQEGPAGPS